MLFTPPQPAAERQAIVAQHYPALCADLKRYRLHHEFQPGPVGFPDHCTLILWREVPGYRYRLGVRPSGEVLAPTGQAMNPAELAALLAELAARWQRSARRADCRFEAFAWQLVQQLCLMLMLIALLFAGLSLWEQDPDNGAELIKLLGGSSFLLVTAIICRYYGRAAARLSQAQR